MLYKVTAYKEDEKGQHYIDFSIVSEDNIPAEREHYRRLVPRGMTCVIHVTKMDR